MAAVWAISALVDRMAQWTVTTYQQTREEIIKRQQQDLLELSTPVIKLFEGVLAVPMIGTLDSSRTQVVMETLLQRIVDTGSELAIIDITGVPTVDTLVAQHLLKTVSAIRLMGAECIISGIRPQIAQTIVHLGIDLQGIASKSSLADALALAMEQQGFVITRRSHKAPMYRIPILQMGQTLLVTIQVDMQDQMALALQDDLANKISSTGAKGVLIDISALEIVDSFVGRMLASISGISRILDATTVVVGMQPAVAITLVELGLSLEGVRTALNVERGMELLAHGRKESAWPLTTRRARCPALRRRHRGQPAEGARPDPAAEVLAGRPDQDDHRGQRAVAQHAGARRRRRHALGTAGRRRAARPAPALRGPGPRHPRHEAGPHRRLDLRRRHGPGPAGQQAAGAEFELQSTPGVGTRVSITRWK
jgi:anti-anti-sigma regulatory factor